MAKAKRLKSLEELGLEFGIQPQKEKNQIYNSSYKQPFYGRKKELEELKKFIQNPDAKIFGLYGIPMIGKTHLVDYFIKNEKLIRNYNKLLISFDNENQDPNPEKILEQFVLGDQEISELHFYKPTLIRIENFQECLEWKGNQQTLHKIKVKYQKIISFIKKVFYIPNVKVIIESRFQLNNIAMNIDISTLPDVEMKGVDPAFFWKLYEKEGVSKYQFEIICNEFSQHTGLLAYAYRFKNVFFRNKLERASRQPYTVTRNLWNLLDEIFKNLLKPARLLLYAITIKPSISYETLVKTLSGLKEFRRKETIEDGLYSLEQKFLIEYNNKTDNYKINPYIREICYSRLKDRGDMKILMQLSYFSNHKKPVYNQVKQALDRNDYGLFYREIHKMEKLGGWRNAIDVLEDVFKNDMIINKAGVLNEMGSIYRKQNCIEEAKKCFYHALELEPENIKVLTELAIAFKSETKFDSALEILEKAIENSPLDKKILNEKGIIYLKKGNKLEAIFNFEKAAQLGNPHSYSELIKLYETEKNYEKALEIARKGVNNHKGDKYLNRQKNRLEGKQLKQQYTTKNKNTPHLPLKEFKKNKQRKENHQKRNRIDIVGLKKLLGNNYFERFFDNFLILLEEENKDNLQNELILLQSRYTENKRENTRGSLDRNKFLETRAKIYTGAMELIKEYKKLKK